MGDVAPPSCRVAPGCTLMVRESTPMPAAKPFGTLPLQVTVWPLVAGSGAHCAFAEIVERPKPTRSARMATGPAKPCRRLSTPDADRKRTPEPLYPGALWRRPGGNLAWGSTVQLRLGGNPLFWHRKMGAFRGTCGSRATLEARSFSFSARSLAGRIRRSETTRLRPTTAATGAPVRDARCRGRWRR